MRKAQLNSGDFPRRKLEVSHVEARLLNSVLGTVVAAVVSSSVKAAEPAKMGCAEIIGLKY
jgi:hypothetical protein